MANHIRIQGFGASRARVIRVTDHIANIVDGTTRIRLLGLRPGESMVRGLTTYESADCPVCRGDGHYEHGDRGVECRACGGDGVYEQCDCGDQMPEGYDACDRCEDLVTVQYRDVPGGL